MATGDSAPSPAPDAVESPFGDRINALASAVADAEGGSITNARKMEAMSTLNDILPSIPRPDLQKHRVRLEDLCEQLLSQNATEPLRQLVVSLLSKLHKQGAGASFLVTHVAKLLKLAGEQNKKVSANTKAAALHVVGELMALHGEALDQGGSSDVAEAIFIVVAKHMKFSEANFRCSALQCLCKTLTMTNLKAPAAGSIWKMLTKVVQDKATTVRTEGAHALSVLAVASPVCACENGDAMAVCCLKALAGDDQSGQASALSSECRFAYAVALAQVLAAMASPVSLIVAERSKKKMAVTDFASALGFLEQAAAKGPTQGGAYVNFRAALTLTIVRLASIVGISDRPTVIILVHMLLGILDKPAGKAKSSPGGAEDDWLAQIARYVMAAVDDVLLLVESEAVLLEVMEQCLVPIISCETFVASRNSDIRMQVVLETLCAMCIKTGEGFQNIEVISKPLLHIVGNYPNTFVQLHAAYCLRVAARSSPPQLFQLMSVLLNLATVQNAELLGAPLPRQMRRTEGGGSSAGGAAAMSQLNADLQPLIRGLYGHCAALAALVSELFHSDLGVPHDVTSAVLGTARALLQPAPNPSVNAQRRSCAFVLLEGLMCLGADWVGQRLTTLFALWKTALGKKPVEKAKVLYQQYIAAGTPNEAAAGPDGSNGCRDELLSLLCALRSLHAFTQHCHETLLTSLPHLHKILVVFLTNVSQLIVALPHPTSASLRAKCRMDAAGQSPVITLSFHCGIPEILLMIRSTMYRTFTVMLPSQYSSRFLPLLNMVADDVTRSLPAEFPVVEFLSHFLHPEDVTLDLVDSHMETSKDGAATIRLAASELLSAAPVNARCEEMRKGHPPDLFTDAAAASFFSGAPRDGPNSIEGLLTPWDAWFDPRHPLAVQCTSAEWDWRCSAIALLAVIMNSSEVSESPRAAVLLHLLKRRDAADEVTPTQSKRQQQPAQQESANIVPSLAVMVYLREHARVRGNKNAPPATEVDKILQLALHGFREANPVLRRLHVEIVALLFFIHHKLPDSAVMPTIIQYIDSETSSDSASVRSAVALLCGAVLRALAWDGAKVAPPGAVRNAHCPYVMTVVPFLLRLAKETSQPVRLWMLHAIHLSMQAAGTPFLPFLKDALRLATAHLLADFFESPLVLWAIAEVVHSAAACVLPTDSPDAELLEENSVRVLSLWRELRRTRYSGPGNGAAFATVRTEVLVVSAAAQVARIGPGDALDFAASKITGNSASFSHAVRAAATRCFVDAGQLQGAAERLADPSWLFSLLDTAERAEADAMRELIKSRLRQHGLAQLPVWLQAIKEVALGASSRSAPKADAKEERGGGDENVGDEASLAGAKKHDDAGEDERRRNLKSATKAFAVSCLRQLVEQVDPEEAGHFQVEVSSGNLSGQAMPEHRLVNHLFAIIALASHASSCNEPSLAEAGLRLMLVIVNRFRLTRDIVAGSDVRDCPLLITQYEAQTNTCIRHNLRPQANPAVVCLALELLRDVIVARACSSTSRLVGMLMQPFASPVYEPDPLFCEYASTKTFIYRLRCACEILHKDPDEQSMIGHLRELARWIEQALRDTAVLLAGLPLQSVKTYQPTSFSLTDYKTVQPCFRAALPTLLRGVCVLCSDRMAPNLPTPPSSDLILLSLGAISMLLADASTKLTEQEMRVYIRSSWQILLYVSTPTPPDAPSSSVARPTVGLTFFLDMLGCIWHNVFRVPQRCAALLPELLGLVHAVSSAILRRKPLSPKLRSKTPQSPANAQSPVKEKEPGETPWLEAICSETEEGRDGRRAVEAYAVHGVAAALRSPAVVDDAGLVTEALEVLVWWLESSFPRSLESPGVENDSGEEEPDAIAAFDGEPEPTERCVWLWLLFASPFPVDLVHAHPAITLKYWKAACNVLSDPKILRTHVAQIGSPMLFLAQSAHRLARLLVPVLKNPSLPESEERTVVYLFAMLVPAVSSLCVVLQHFGSSNDDLSLLSSQAKSAVNACLIQVKEVFAEGARHHRAKVVTTTVSSVQSLLQNSACLLLCPVIMPNVLLTLANPVNSPPDSKLDNAWPLLTSLSTSPQSIAVPMARLILGMVLCVAESSKKSENGEARRAPMVQCLVQLAMANKDGVKVELSAMPADAQATIQQVLRDAVAAATAANTMISASPKAPGKKVELKMKF